MNDKTQQPVHNIRVGGINGAIWEQKAQNGNFYNATFSRSYKNEKEEWKTSHTYTVNQLDDLRRAITEAETYINEQTRAQPDKEKGAMDRFEARNEQSMDGRDNETER
jgi:tRNA A37 threonylcarbamoyladenosine modification protein TsaB